MQEEIKLINGDCLVKLKELETNSVDSIVTDPPYELGFMGKKWDSTGIANNVELWKECLRVLKPGGHLLAFSGTRTYHRMASVIEDAGFEVRDMIEWVYGSGFPKSLNIGKAVKALQETGGSSPRNLRKARMGEDYTPTGQEDYRKGRMFSSEIENDNTKEEINNEYEGWGTALKPAHEPICMARKPLAEKTVAENCLKYGTGGINIDESRVDYNGEVPNIGGRANHTRGDGYGFKELGDKIEANIQGRFPANLIHDNSEEVRECFPETGKSKSGGSRGNGEAFFGNRSGFERGGIDDNGGNASRFFKSIIYQAKASKSERNKGCDGLEEKEEVYPGINTFDESGNRLRADGSVIPPLKSKNNHPTVKPIALMEYLIKMVTPKNGIVLDPFMGSGSTGVAAKQNCYNFIGIELDEKYFEIAKNRIENLTN